MQTYWHTVAPDRSYNGINGTNFNTCSTFYLELPGNKNFCAVSRLVQSISNSGARKGIYLDNQSRNLIDHHALPRSSNVEVFQFLWSHKEFQDFGKGLIPAANISFTTPSKPHRRLA